MEGYESVNLHGSPMRQRSESRPHGDLHASHGTISFLSGRIHRYAPAAIAKNLLGRCDAAQS